MKIRWKDEVREVDPAAPVDESVGGSLRAAVVGPRVFVWWRGRSWDLVAEKGGRSGSAGRRPESTGGLLSPMPGRIRQVLVAEGDRVAKGQVLLVLEAMKMEHAIRSPHDGRVTKLAFAEGDLVDAGAVLADVSSDASDSM